MVAHKHCTHHHGLGDDFLQTQKAKQPRLNKKFFFGCDIYFCFFSYCTEISSCHLCWETKLYLTCTISLYLWFHHSFTESYSITRLNRSPRGLHFLLRLKSSFGLKIKNIQRNENTDFEYFSVQQKIRLNRVTLYLNLICKSPIQEKKREIS